MIRAAAGADILAALLVCLGDACTYRLVQSRSQVPAECDTISLVWGSRNLNSLDDCGLMACDVVETHELSITLTRCCVAPDGGVTFNADAEESETICFLRDLEIIEQCLLCTDWRQFSIDHGVDRIRVISTTPGSTRGGCMDATVRVQITANQCCPVP